MREEKKAEKRQELVGVCLDCFVEKGLTVATTKDLCKAAKLQNGGIYYYFSAKRGNRSCLRRGSDQSN